MKKLVEYIFNKLPGDDENLSYSQKVWVVIIAVTFSVIIAYKAISHIIRNF